MTAPSSSLSRIITYQDYEAAQDKRLFLVKAVTAHQQSAMVQLAEMADRYDRQQNDTINNYVQTLLTFAGDPVEDFTASNNKIASNFFQRLNTQRCMYSLGNGVTFAEGGQATKQKLGEEFDELIQDGAYNALIHGISFMFWNVDKVHNFKLTEFVPLWDEETGVLRAGIRYWRVDTDKPMTLTHYEEDGYTTYTQATPDAELVEKEPKRAYQRNLVKAPADLEPTIVGEENYGSLPIVPIWGSRKKQSTLVGMREAIDSFDLIRSGFANDLTDCSQIYWIIENAGGMSDKDLARFRDRMKITHMAEANTEDGGSIRPYAQDIPYQARKQYLDDIRAGIYEDFGGLDVHTIAAGATNDHIDAAYQPMDENAADFERQVTRCILGILKLAGIEDAPVYKRNRISNQREQVEMVAIESQWLDDETILSKLPNISADEIAEILKRKDANELDRAGFGTNNPNEELDDEEGDEDANSLQ